MRRDGPAGHADDLALALRLADAAATLALDYFRGPLRRWRKPDGSLVTEADERVEDELRRLLADERPHDAVLGEERGATGEGPRRWILDAIDGTAFFAEGSPDWGTLIALEVEGRLVCGVCSSPAHGRRQWASRGGGAFCVDAAGAPPRRLAVSTTAGLSGARGYVHGEDWWRTERAEAVARTLSAAIHAHPPTDHPALQVADGSSDLAVFFAGGPWDYAAPAIIVEEAGGRFTDLDGRATLTSGHALVSNGLLHEALLGLTGRPPGGEVR